MADVDSKVIEDPIFRLSSFLFFGKMKGLQRQFELSLNGSSVELKTRKRERYLKD